MNSSEAKLILQMSRINGEDSGDALVQEALEQARLDPELQRWFAQEQSIDRRLQNKLVIPVPPEIKANLLALRTLAESTPFWRKPKWLSLAAAFLVLFGIAALLLPRSPNPTQLSSFRNAMVRYSKTAAEHVQLETSDFGAISRWLRERNIEPDFELPFGLRGKHPEGCRVVDWNGRRAALICFVLNGGNHVDLFVLKGAPIPGLAESGQPQFVQASGRMTVTWSKNGQAYLLTGSDKTLLQKLVQRT
jgi:hypothetical protein